jgi:4'-phosphopantetheinyl transferase
VHAAARIQNFIWECSNVASGIELWTIPLAGSCSTALLSPEECDRAARFKWDKDRIPWINAHSALREILATYAGVRPESLHFTCNENGKPALDGQTGIEFNLSHSGEFALIAVSTSAPVGVDIERIRPEVEIAALLVRLGETDLPETVPELYHRWTRREARSKAVGGQLFIAPPSEIEALDVPAPAGYAASIASELISAGRPKT